MIRNHKNYYCFNQQTLKARRKTNEYNNVANTSSACISSNNIHSAVETIVLVKKGKPKKLNWIWCKWILKQLKYINSRSSFQTCSFLGYIAKASLNCPPPLLWCFNYSFNDGYTTYCEGSSVWDVCSNPTQIVVNYTLCSTKQFFSSM